MNMKLTKGLLGLGAMLLASQVNAATIQMSPSTQTVSVNDPLSITVEGVDFFNGASSGGVRVTWDTTQLSMQSTAQNIVAGLTAAGFGDFFQFDFNAAAGILDTTFLAPFDIITGTFGNVAGPTFTLFTLDFIAVPPPSTSNLAISISSLAGAWQDANNTAIVVDHIGASVTVNAVPVPAAVWLFGSGLIGLVGISRRKPQLA